MLYYSYIQEKIAAERAEIAANGGVKPKKSLMSSVARMFTGFKGAKPATASPPSTSTTTTTTSDATSSPVIAI